MGSLVRHPCLTRHCPTPLAWKSGYSRLARASLDGAWVRGTGKPGGGHSSPLQAFAPSSLLAICHPCTRLHKNQVLCRQPHAGWRSWYPFGYCLLGNCGCATAGVWLFSGRGEGNVAFFFCVGHSTYRSMFATALGLLETVTSHLTLAFRSSSFSKHHSLTLAEALTTAW